MANLIESWSTTAASNTTVGGISIAEGTFARNLNDGVRAVMSDVASWRDATNGVKITTGSLNAYVLSSGLSLAALAQKVRVTFEANHTNTGASTLALDGLSATDIRRVDGSALTAGDLTAGGIYDVAYEAGAAKFLLLNPTPTPTAAGVFTTIELGATDTTLSRSGAGVMAVEGVVIPSISSTNTLTNKRVTPRIGTTAGAAAPTPNADSHDEYNVTALAQAATFGAPTGTPTEGQKIILRIKDNGTARALAFNAIYRAGTDVALPTTTVLSKTLYLGFVYNGADTTWDLLAKIDNI